MVLGLKPVSETDYWKSVSDTDYYRAHIYTATGLPQSK